VTPVTSIRTTMMRVVLTTTFFALLLSAVALLLYELGAYRTSWIDDLKTQGNLVAQSSMSALAFDDPRAARENLSLLRLRPQIEAAAIYDGDDRLYASYSANGQEPPSATLADKREGHFFEGDRLDLQLAIEQNGERLGTMVLRARYDVMPRLRDYLAILGAVSLASLALASLIAQRLQRTVTDPIVAVADVARDVVQRRNYSLRAEKTTEDEVGALVDAFNDMLGELGGQAAALQAADRRKDEFLAILAHELRNPLAPLTTALSVLSRDEADPVTKARMRAIMQRQLQQLVRLIDDLLDVSRISTGRLALRLEPLDLVEVLRSAVDSVTPGLQERRHALVVAWPAPIWVSADRTRLAQIFVNLLGNAARYTDPGGRIEIAFEVAAASVAVRIIDNGTGIDPSMHGQVFEMFIQVDKSIERGRAGLGVGLALARQLVELHGGTIAVASAGLGQGSTFTVRLPRLADAEQPAGSVVAKSAVPAPRGLRILVADDNGDYADSLAVMLEAAGHRIEVVYDGNAALQAATTRRPQVGLFDIGMPGLNGYELARRVREATGGEILMIAITGWGQEADRQRARAAGFDHHFVKPVDVEALLDLLDRHARDERTVREAPAPPSRSLG